MQLMGVAIVLENLSKTGGNLIFVKFGLTKCALIKDSAFPASTENSP